MKFSFEMTLLAGPDDTEVPCQIEAEILNMRSHYDEDDGPDLNYMKATSLASVSGPGFSYSPGQEVPLDSANSNKVWEECWKQFRTSSEETYSGTQFFGSHFDA